MAYSHILWELGILTPGQRKTKNEFLLDVFVRNMLLLLNLCIPFYIFPGTDAKKFSSCPSGCAGIEKRRSEIATCSVFAKLYLLFVVEYNSKLSTIFPPTRSGPLWSQCWSPAQLTHHTTIWNFFKSGIKALALEALRYVKKPMSRTSRMGFNLWIIFHTS